MKERGKEVMSDIVCITSHTHSDACRNLHALRGVAKGETRATLSVS